MRIRKSRAKWRRGAVIRSLRELLDYVGVNELAGMRRQDIMLYGPWSGFMAPGIRNAWSKPNHRGARPTSAMVLLNMPFALVERLARGSLWRAERRDGDD